MRFGRRLRMSAISAGPTCTAIMHVRAICHKYNVLRYLIWFLDEKCSQHCLHVCVLRDHFIPVKCSETTFIQPRASLPDTL